MIIILKPLFEVLTGDVSVLDNLLYNYLIMLVVGETAYRVARGFVRGLYHIGLIEGNASGSVIHWAIRLIFYMVIAYLIRGGIWIYNLVLSIPHWIWWLLVAITVTSTFVAIYFNSNSQKAILTGKASMTTLNK